MTFTLITQQLYVESIVSGQNGECAWEVEPVKRRTKWVLGLSVGIPVGLIAIVMLVLRLSSPNPELDLASIEVKELPSIWTQEPVSADVVDGSVEGESEPITNTMDSPNVEDLDEIPILAPTIDEYGLPISGTLIMESEDKPFGEETFELSLEDDDVMLRSNGKFWFKALIATVTLNYDQVLRMDSHLRPLMLSSAFDAPFGFSRNVQAEFTDGGAIVRSGDDVKEFIIDLDRAFVLGTFSTYAILPLLYELREFEGEVGLETLVFGGPPTSSEGAPTDKLPETRISRIEDAEIQFDERQLTVSQYEISGNMGTMTLYALGVEMLGLLAGDDDEESLFVYRADYFKDGFDVGD